jgi:hypothetical protein
MSIAINLHDMSLKEAIFSVCLFIVLFIITFCFKQIGKNNRIKSNKELDELITKREKNILKE